MIVQETILLIMIGILISIIPFYLYKRHNQNKSFIKHFFLVNILGCGFAALIIITASSGSYPVFFFVSGLSFFISGGLYKGYKSIIDKWKIIAIIIIFIISGAIFIILLFNWVFNGKNYIPIPFNQAIITSSYQESLILVLIAAINALPVFSLYEVRHERRMEWFIIGIICLTTILLVFIDVTMPMATQDLMTQLIFKTIQEPLVSTALVLMVFGAILKSIDNWQAGIIGDIMVFFLPLLIWTMVVIGQYMTPEDLIHLFKESETDHLLSTFTYSFIMGIIFMIETGMIVLFTGLTREKVNLF